MPKAMTQEKAVPVVELKACPFCGGKPHIEFSHEAGQWDVYEFECECGISAYGPCGHTGDAAKEALIRKWNTRTDEQQAAIIAELVVAASKFASVAHRAGPTTDRYWAACERLEAALAKGRP